MIKDFYIILDGKTNLDLGLEIVSKPNLPSPVEIVDIVKINGREDTYKHTGIYEDMVINIEFNFDAYDEDYYTIKDIFRKLKVWLLNIKDNKLVFSDEMDWYYKVNNITISETALQEIEEFGNCNVEFTLNPYQYKVDGSNEILYNNTIFHNAYFPSQPKYIIEGNGLCTLTVNGNDLQVNVANNCTINTELGLCFREDGSFYNVANNIKSYKDFYLQTGENNISISDGFTLKIIPNWRCL